MTVEKDDCLKNQEDLDWMNVALRLAEAAACQGEVPVGAVIVTEGRIVGQGFNQRESLQSSLRHAEITAIEDASNNLGRWRLHDCTLYVTLEPCLMCAGAIVQSRLNRVVYGATDPKAGAIESLYQIFLDLRLNHRPQFLAGVAQNECSLLLSQFFMDLRQSKKQHR